jgi:hypothetical protein
MPGRQLFESFEIIGQMPKQLIVFSERVVFGGGGNHYNHFGILIVVGIVLYFRFQLLDFVFLPRNQTVNLFPFPVFVHKSVGNINLYKMEDKKEKPDGYRPYIPNYRVAQFEQYIGNKHKKAPD